MTMIISMVSSAIITSKIFSTSNTITTSATTTTTSLALALLASSNNNNNNSENQTNNKNIDYIINQRNNHINSINSIEKHNHNSSMNKMNSFIRQMKDMNPRAKASIYMTIGMSLHYGGYEFLRNSILALFTSSSMGFGSGTTLSSTAYPLANGLVSPFSVLLLYFYGQQLNQYGPRSALRTTTICSIVFIVFVTCMLQAMQMDKLIIPKQIPKIVIGQIVIGISFLFQNSYNYLIATQQWSFINSVLTPNEGAKWFTIITGTSSLFCTITGSLAPYIVPYTGLIGLFGITAITLSGSLLCQDIAYQISQKHGFDPSSKQQQQQQKQKKNTTTQTLKKNNNDKTIKELGGNNTALLDDDSTNDENKNNKSNKNKDQLITTKAIDVFRNVPTLRALFLEVLSFQSLNTILTVSLVEKMKNDITNDIARSAYSSQFYAMVNGSSAMLQFFLLPLFLQKVEPKIIWRIMPIIPFFVCSYQAIMQGQLPLSLLALAVYVTKTMDYSIRSVVYNMAYQPLDFNSRYVGKEIIGVFGSRFGKSGMSLFVSGLTYLNIIKSLKELSYVSLTVSTLWISSTWWLSRLIPSKAEAQQIVEDRIIITNDDDKSKKKN